MTTDSNTQSQATARDKLAADITAVVQDAGELLKAFNDHKLQRDRQALIGAQNAITGRAGEFGAVAGDYVNAHPWRAIGVAGAAGLLLGLLLARR